MQQKETLAKHSAILEKLAEKTFPEYLNLKIFPIGSMEQLEDIESKLSNYSEETLVWFACWIGKKYFVTYFYISDYIHKAVNWDFSA